MDEKYYNDYSSCSDTNKTYLIMGGPYSDIICIANTKEMYLQCISNGITFLLH